MGRRLSSAFPSEAGLLRLRARLDILMPVVRVDAEIVGFALTALLTTEEGRLGSVRYLSARGDEGPAAWATKAALLSRLEEQLLALESYAIEVATDHPPVVIDQLQRIGFRHDDDSVSGGSSLIGSGPRLVKRLSTGVSVGRRSSVRSRRA
jgi:hypothetical protein